MNSSPIVFTLLEILKYTIPAIVVLIASFLIIKKFLTSEIDRQRLAIFGENSKVTIPMRLQSYERLILFVERLQIPNLIQRFYVTNSSATDLQLAIVQSIRSEYEYNLSQQIYVSKEVWQTITSAKEQEIAMINGLAIKLPPNSSAKQFAEMLTEYYATQESETPSQIALLVINREAKSVLLSV